MSIHIPRTPGEDDIACPFSALPSPIAPHSPPPPLNSDSPMSPIAPSAFAGSYLGAALSTIPEQSTAPSLPSLPTNASHRSMRLGKLPLLPPLTLQIPVATSMNDSRESTLPPRTPDSASESGPGMDGGEHASPARSLKDLKACLARPAGEMRGKEDTWQEAMRGGFLTFSSNL